VEGWHNHPRADHQAAPDKSRVSPLVYYYLSYFAGKMGQPQKATEYLQLAIKAPVDYVFPSNVK